MERGKVYAVNGAGASESLKDGLFKVTQMFDPVFEKPQPSIAPLVNQ
jgi:hypothetical protein